MTYTGWDNREYEDSEMDAYYEDFSETEMREGEKTVNCAFDLHFTGLFGMKAYSFGSQSCIQRVEAGRRYLTLSFETAGQADAFRAWYLGWLEEDPERKIIALLWEE